MAAIEAAMEDVEFVDFNQDDDAMDEDALADSRAGRRAARARAFSVPRVLSGATASAARILGRVRSGVLGHSPSVVATAPEGLGSLSDATDAGGLGHGPQRSIEGWIILVTGVEEDAEEDDLYNAFSEFGHVNNLHFNLESCTGYAKGYALIEYESFEEAQTAIKALNGRQLLTKTVYVDWAVSKSPPKQLSHMRSSRSRSRTPPRGLAALTTF